MAEGRINVFISDTYPIPNTNSDTVVTAYNDHVYEGPRVRYTEQPESSPLQNRLFTSVTLITIIVYNERCDLKIWLVLLRLVNVNLVILSGLD